MRTRILSRVVGAASLVGAMCVLAGCATYRAEPGLTILDSDTGRPVPARGGPQRYPVLVVPRMRYPRSTAAVSSSGVSELAMSSETGS